MNSSPTKKGFRSKEEVIYLIEKIKSIIREKEREYILSRNALLDRIEEIKSEVIK